MNKSFAASYIFEKLSQANEEKKCGNLGTICDFYFLLSGEQPPFLYKSFYIKTNIYDKDKVTCMTKLYTIYRLICWTTI